MKPDKKIILEVGTLGTETLVLSTISIHTSVEIPFTGWIIDHNLNHRPNVGDLFEVNDKGIWVNKIQYQVHNYEIATVLGKQEQDLLVYGNKIGECVIRDYKNGSTRPAVFDIQRGDKLLLIEYMRSSYGVLRNITQEKMKYEHSRAR